MKLTDTAIKVLKGRYLREGETPEDMLRRVAIEIADTDKVASLIECEKDADTYYNMMNSLDFLPSSPFLVNGGLTNHLFSCFVLDIEDSMKGIFRTLADAALIQKSHGGSGFYFSNLRSANSLISTAPLGRASGPVKFMELYDKLTDVVKQGANRRGALMAVLRIDHPDIIEFLTCKLVEGVFENFNISVSITDEFMEAVENDDSFELIEPSTGNVVKIIDARHLFDVLCESTWKLGEPGVLFFDEINRKNPYPELGELKATNPCVPASTRLNTTNGMIRMSDLNRTEDDKSWLPVIVDDNFVDTIRPAYKATWPFMTSEMDDIYEITTQKGYRMRSNLTHDYYRKAANKKGWLKAELKDIMVGDKVFLAKTTKGWGKVGTTDLGYVVGAIMANKHMHFYEELVKGEYVKTLAFDFRTSESSHVIKCAKTPKLIRWYNDRLDTIGAIMAKASEDGKSIQCNRFLNARKECIKYVRSVAAYEFFKNEYDVSDETVGLPEIAWRGTAEFFKGFMRAIFHLKGEVVDEKKLSLRIKHGDDKLLEDIQKRLLSHGIISTRSKIHKNKSIWRREYLFPVDEYQLLIEDEFVLRYLLKIGLEGKTAKGLIFRLRKYTDDISHVRYADTVVSIEQVGREPVYCVTQTNGNSVIFEGFATGNCGEAALLPNEACCLGSINMANMLIFSREGYVFDSDKYTKTFVNAVKFLDAGFDANVYPTEDIKAASLRTRKVGLGVMGFADMLMYMKIPYGNSERFNALMRSIDLAQKRAKDILSKQGYDNKIMTTIAPTGSISVIAGVSGGIEPNFALSYANTVLEDQQVGVVIKPAKDYFGSFFDGDVILEIIKKTGSVQNADINDNTKEVFRTASEISPDDHLYVQAEWQKITDNAISKTINLPGEASVNDIKDIFMKAWKSKVKGLTVYRDGSRTLQMMNKPSEAPEESPINRTEDDHKASMGKRPGVLCGCTHKVRSPEGKYYLTVNYLDDEPFEIFSTVNAGASLEASVNSEALCRLTSLALRHGIDPEFIITQMKKVRNQSLLSLPFNIAKALEENPQSNSILSNGMLVCPECNNNTYVKEGGCGKCMHCGFSSCS